ncbi:MAG: 1-deoxy-D-xylulose-5-phosphate synthase [Spirochaetaceae bacterium]|jgi:1-deoxy-D-xylulose-5-phosphate synthase|nr:1-deoxy-D-xylulose-5-phosphate synthase [Spirochaetaceae bacterium]
MHESLLARIAGPRDLRGLPFPDLNRLAAEIRGLIVSTVSKNGGHLASNLGVVELTLAIHRVFESPEDKIVWDVGHQCYTHKLLTGRYKEFGSLRKIDGLAGFPKRSESIHDVFDTGHASTAISAALGLLAGERLSGRPNRVAAVIGDGALTGGMAYEALSHAGQLGLPLIVILNDNKMSIGPNVGGISKYLSRLSMKARYQSFRRTFDGLVKRIPLIGPGVFDIVVRLKRAVKAVFYTDNFFVDLGFEYVGPIDGHNLGLLEEVFQDVRRLDRPVVVHVITRKGKGCDFAEEDPSSYHGVSGNLEEAQDSKKLKLAKTSAGLGAAPVSGRPTFTDAFGKALLEAGARDPRIMAVTAAMEKGTGLSPFKQAYPKRFFDVGIAEEHAVTFAAGLAAQGLRPVAAIYSTFIQRAVDQVIHDTALQRLPVVFALDRAGFVSDDGETHQGLFDIGLFRPIPNMTILAPASGGELRRMLDWALTEPRPTMIRYPKGLCPPEIGGFSQPLVPGRGVFVREWESNLCLAFTGSLYPEVWAGADRLLEANIPADLYNLRFLKPVDEQYLAEILNRYDLVVFIEEGMLEGGFGEYAAELGARKRCTAQVYALGVSGDYLAQGKREELLRANGLDGEGIARSIRRMYAENRILAYPARHRPPAG